MKKRIKQILQRIQQYQQQIKNHKISLLEKYKHYHGDKNHDYTKNTTAYNYNTTHSKINRISNISHPLKQLETKKVYKRDMKNKYEIKREHIGELLNNLQENDILITCEISRLGRSLLEVMKILETCLNKNCQVWTLKENYRLGNDIQSKVLAFAFGLAAEIERNLISQRTKSSLANIKASGKKLGRPFAAESKKLKLSKNTRKLKLLWEKGLSKAAIARVFGVHRSTVRHFIDRLEAQTS